MFSVYGNAPVTVGKVEESAIVAGSGTISELKLSARGVLPQFAAAVLLIRDLNLSSSRDRVARFPFHIPMIGGKGTRLVCYRFSKER